MLRRGVLASVIAVATLIAAGAYFALGDARFSGHNERSPFTNWNEPAPWGADSEAGCSWVQVNVFPEQIRRYVVASARVEYATSEIGYRFVNENETILFEGIVSRPSPPVEFRDRGVQQSLDEGDTFVHGGAERWTLQLFRHGWIVGTSARCA